MALAPGSRFDHYEVLAPLGKGGMGEVLRARDTRLNREVAIKVLPGEVAHDADRLRRFEQGDGRFIVYYAPSGTNTGSDLWVLPLEEERKPFLFLQTPFDEEQGRFSPDGRWIAYVSNDQGRREVFVQTYPAAGGKWQVSINGGTSAHWRSDGKELFYVSADNKLMAVEVKPGSSFEAGMPKALFDLEPLRVSGGSSGSGYTVTADGQRFLFVMQGEAPANLQYTVVVNWAAEAKK